MKLYHNGEGWQLPGQQDKKAERIDVPDKAAELAAWLNERRVTVAPSAALFIDEIERIEQPEPQLASEGSAEASGNPNRCAKCKSILSATIAGADASAISRDIAAIGDWAEAAPTWAIERLTEIIQDKARGITERGRVN